MRKIKQDEKSKKNWNHDPMLISLKTSLSVDTKFPSNFEKDEKPFLPGPRWQIVRQKYAFLICLGEAISLKCKKLDI